MSQKQRHIPAYRPHKASGQARVIINREHIYLGKFGSPESQEKYHRLVAEWIASGRTPAKTPDPAPQPVSVNELLLAFSADAARRYVKDGRPTSEINSYKIALGPVRLLYGCHAVANFGPLALIACRERLIEAGICRKRINQHIGRIRHVFKWGVAREMVAETVWRALCAVEGLKRGEACETEPVKPVLEDRITAVLPLVTPQVRAMIELQLWSGCRPGEACVMRTIDINTQGKIWEYHPHSHKGQHHEKDRVVYLGPHAQEILKPWLKTDLHAYVFSPREARAWSNARRIERAKSTNGKKGRKRKPNPKRKPGERYTDHSYDHAIRRGCELAFDMPKELRNIPTATKVASGEAGMDDREGAEGLLREIGPEQFDGKLFSSAERDRLLREIDDIELLKRMPIHEDSAGKFGAIGRDSYWEGTFRVDALLCPLVRILKYSQDPLVCTRQRQLAPTFDASTAIQVVYRHGHPERYWRPILDAIAALTSLGGELQPFLKNSEWMPTRAGGFVRPDDVIHIVGLDEEIARIISRAKTGFCGKQSLHDDLIGHKAFGKLLQWCFPSSKDAIAMLGTIMATEESWCIGCIPVTESGEAHSDWFGDFLKYFRDAPTGTMPCHAVLTKLAANSAQRLLAGNLVAELRHRISTPRLLQVLEHLQAQHGNVPREEKPRVLSLYNTYLVNTIEATDFRNVFPKIHLLSRLGRWKLPGQLCYLDIAEDTAATGSGLDQNEVVDASQGALLRPICVTADPDGEQPGPGNARDAAQASTETAATTLQQYFSKWDGYVPREVIGGFLAVLGDDPNVRTLAKYYLGNHSLEIIRARIGFQDYKTLMHRRVEVSATGARDGTVPVLSLSGTPFSARMASQSSHILLPYAPKAFPTKSVGDFCVTQLRLRAVSAKDLTADQLSQLLRETTRLFVKSVYRSHDTEIDLLWEDLAHSEQLDIRIAQKMIRDALPFYLRQLGLQERGDIRLYAC